MSKSGLGQSSLRGVKVPSSFLITFSRLRYSPSWVSRTMWLPEGTGSKSLKIKSGPFCLFNRNLETHCSKSSPLQERTGILFVDIGPPLKERTRRSLDPFFRPHSDRVAVSFCNSFRLWIKCWWATGIPIK